MACKRRPGPPEVPGRFMPQAGFDFAYIPRKVAVVTTAPLEAVNVLGESE